MLKKDEAYMRNNTDIGAAGNLSFIRHNIRQQALVHLLRGYEMLGVSPRTILCKAFVAFSFLSFIQINGITQNACRRVHWFFSYNIVHSCCKLKSVTKLNEAFELLQLQQHQHYGQATHLLNHQPNSLKTPTHGET